MTVTIIFRNRDDNRHTGQSFEVSKWEFHTYPMLELIMKDGTQQFFNYDSIFSFQVKP